MHALLAVTAIVSSSVAAARHSRINPPQTINGQARRTNRSAVASSANDAGSWPKLSAVSAALIKSGRPASVRWPGRKVLLAK